MIRILTAHYSTIGVHIIPRYRKTLICVATSPESLAAMQDAARDSDGPYRLSWHHPRRRHIVCHETREHTTVTAWDVDHAPKSRDERLVELEAAPMYEPMEEGIAA